MSIDSVRVLVVGDVGECFMIFGLNFFLRSLKKVSECNHCDGLPRYFYISCFHFIAAGKSSLIQLLARGRPVEDPPSPTVGCELEVLVCVFIPRSILFLVGAFANNILVQILVA